MNSNIKILIILFLFSISCLMNSCSLIGFGIGSVVDKKKPISTKINFDHIDKLLLETKVEVIKSNGDTVSGRYNGIIPIYSRDFYLNYDSIKQNLSDQVKLPNLNDTLLIFYNNNKTIWNTGLFMGFESETLWCKYTYGNNYFSIGLDSIISIAINNEYNIDSVQIKSYIVKHKFPNFIYLKIGTKEKITENIALLRIRRIQTFDSRNAKFIGLGVGLAMDAIIAVAFVNSMQNMTFEMSF